MHFSKEFWNVAVDLGKIVERDRYEINVCTILLMELDEFRKFIASGVAPRRPKIYYHWAIRRTHDPFQARSIDLQNLRADPFYGNIPLGIRTGREDNQSQYQ